MLDANIYNYVYNKSVFIKFILMGKEEVYPPD